MNKKICELKKENKLNEKNNIFKYLFRKLKIKNQAILVSWSERPLQIGFLWFMGHKPQSNLWIESNLLKIL